MFKQGPAATADSHPSGVKKLREDTEKDEDSGFNLGKIVQALPSQGLLKAKPCLPGCGVRGGNACDTQPMFLGPTPFPWLLWDCPSCHIFLAVT